MKVLVILGLLIASSVVDSAVNFESEDWNCAKQCRDKKIDMVFVVDGSNSSRFYRSKTKIFSILKAFKTHKFVHRMKVHFIHFGGDIYNKTDNSYEYRAYNICAEANKLIINKAFDGCDTFKQFKAKMLRVKKLKGEPDWFDAKKKANSLDLRPDSVKVLVTIVGDEMYDEEKFLNLKIIDGWKRFDFTYQLFVGKQLPAERQHACDDNCFYANEGEELYKAAATMSRDICCSYIEPTCLKKCGSKPLDLVFLLLGDQTQERYMSNLFTLVEKSWEQLKIDESFYKVHVEVHKVDPGSDITEHKRNKSATGMSLKLVSEVCTKMQMPYGCEQLEDAKRRLRSLNSPLNATELKPAISFASNATNFQFRENSHKVLIMVFDGLPSDFNYSMYEEGQLSRDVEGLNAVFDYKQAWFINMESKDKHIAGFECSHLTNGFNFQTSMNKLRSVIGCPIDENHQDCTGRAGCSPENLPVFKGGRNYYEFTPWYEVGMKAIIKCDPGRTAFNGRYSVCQEDGSFKPRRLKCEFGTLLTRDWY